jgi:hypothetical protein
MEKKCIKCNISYTLDKFDRLSSIWCTGCYIEKYGIDYKEMLYPEPKKSKYTKYNNKRKKYWSGIDYYRQEVKELTELNKHKVDNIESRNFLTHHIDHKISIKYGYDNSIPAKHIADPSNLHILEKKDNILKNDRNIIDENNKWILPLE